MKDSKQNLRMPHMKAPFFQPSFTPCGYLKFFLFCFIHLHFDSFILGLGWWWLGVRGVV
jgi:hypothetical protein